MPRWLEPIHALVKSRYFYPAVFIACSIPAITLVLKTYQGDLGVNPVETLQHETGEDTLLMLFGALSVTPVRRLTGWNKVQSVRRMVGIWSFAYASAHFLVYFVFDQLSDVQLVWQDVLKRRFIFAGMLAFLMLLALAVTSTNGMIRRLRRGWQPLHRLIYVAAIAGVVHFVWGQKADIGEPLRWATVLAGLLGLRVYFYLRKRRVRRLAAEAIQLTP